MTIKARTTITVKEWFFDKVNEAAKDYGIYLIGGYKDGILDSKLRIEEVFAETEKAYKVAIDAETIGGKYKAWTTWIPKSVVEA